ncbi:hypothetical protein Poly30_46150 [Planctomycetes bacterium Poly30]|uniref:Heme oxygenase n=1 Tax=Saltatorellus ferox TaxID=2528018 RepID=A0A518EYA0_9BACT|nr:hypothetical protein Poly30_46150 [Planctomycetes bacterium Poly30]
MTTLQHSSLADLERKKAALGDHPAYQALDSLSSLRRFMEHHVICVLDFMSIVKSLQRDLTSMGPVWLPPADAEVARFINEIILDEESDAEFPRYAAAAGLGRRGPASHFEWYLAAMDEVGADTGPIRGVVERLRAGEDPLKVLRSCALPDASAEFGRHTFELLCRPLHVRAAVFFHGREDVIPRMFMPLVRELQASGTPCGLLLGYLERHIQADGDHHGPLARQMLATIFGGDVAKISEGILAAEAALEARRALWDALAPV